MERHEAFRFNSQQLFATYPHCHLNHNQVLDCFKALGHPILRYVIAIEKHQDGSPHVHAYIKFESKLDIRDSSYFDIVKCHGNYQGVRSAKNVIEYCVKDGEFIANFDVRGEPTYRSVLRRDLARRIIQTDNLVPIVEENPELIFQFRSLTESLRLFRMQREPIVDWYDVRGVWLWGPPGVGKSHAIRAQNPSLYLKPQNKWWDGYSGEKAVLLDDMDLQGKCLSHYLKIWADKYAFAAEVKGSTIRPRYEKFIVTSNYSIGEIFGEEDAALLRAIERRFVVIYMDKQCHCVDVQRCVC